MSAPRPRWPGVRISQCPAGSHPAPSTFTSAMTYEGIEFHPWAGLGRNEWTLLIAYPDRAEPFVTQANGSRDDVIAAARKTDRCLD